MSPADWNKRSQLPQSLQFKSRHTDSRYGKVGVFKDPGTGKYIMAKDRMTNKKSVAAEYILEAKHRIRLNNRYLMGLKDWDIETKSDFCSTNHRVTEFWDMSRNDLGKEIKERGKEGKGFCDQELTYMLFNSTHAIANLNDNRLNHNEITPSYIDMGIPGRFDYRIIERSHRYEEYKQVAYNNHAMGRLQYLPPEVFDRVSNLPGNNPNANFDIQKCDSFSLGMTLLRAGTMRSLRNCYDYDNNKFIVPALQEHLRVFNQKYNENPLLCESLSQLLMVNPSERWNLQYLRSELPPIDEIKEYYEDYDPSQQTPGFNNPVMAQPPQINPQAAHPQPFAPQGNPIMNSLPPGVNNSMPPAPQGNMPLSRRNFGSRSNHPQNPQARRPSNRNRNFGSQKKPIGNPNAPIINNGVRPQSTTMRRSPSQPGPQARNPVNPLNSALLQSQNKPPIQNQNQPPVQNPLKPVGAPIPPNQGQRGILQSRPLNRNPSNPPPQRNQTPGQINKQPVVSSTRRMVYPNQRNQNRSVNSRRETFTQNQNPGVPPTNPAAANPLNRSNYVSNSKIQAPQTTVRRTYSTDIRNRSGQKPPINKTTTPYYPQNLSNRGNRVTYTRPGQSNINPKTLTSSYYNNPSQRTNYPITSKYLSQMNTQNGQRISNYPAPTGNYNSRGAYTNAPNIIKTNPVRIEGGTLGGSSRRYSAARRPSAGVQRGATPVMNKTPSNANFNHPPVSQNVQKN